MADFFGKKPPFRGIFFLGVEIWDPPLSLELLLLLLLLRIKNGQNSIFQNLIFFSTIKLFDISYDYHFLHASLGLHVHSCMHLCKSE